MIEESNKSNPIITVICPIYNDADLVSQSIDSVLRQTMRNFKFIILDNGSTDHTRKIISDYNDSRITIINSHLNIKSEIMASLLLNVDTPYLAQIYSDDVWEPKKLAISLEKIIRTDCDAVFSNNSFIGDDGQFLRDEEVPRSQFVGDISSMSIDEHLYKFIFRGNTLHPVSMVIKADSYRRLGGVKPYLHSVGDMEFFARLLLNGTVSFLEEKLQRIRIKSTGRQNESAPSRASYLRVIGERMRFLDLLSTPQFMSRMESIFFPEMNIVAIDPAMRKWFLGHQIMKLGDPDCALIGMQLLYSALDENMESIEKYIIVAHGKSIGQYIEDMASNCFLTGVSILAGLDEDTAAEFARLNNIIKGQHEELINSHNAIVNLEKYLVADESSGLRLENKRLVEEIQESRNERSKSEIERDRLSFIQTNHIEKLNKEISALRGSTSWRVTAPLRNVVLTLRRLRPS